MESVSAQFDLHGCTARRRAARNRRTATGGANLPLAWDVTTGHNSVVLAIIDTGIVNHQDLNGAGIAPFSATYVPNGRFLAGYDFISEGVGAGTVPANFVANDGNGRDADASDPGDFVTTRKKPIYPTTLCDDGETGPAEQQLARQSHGGVAAAASQQRTRDRGRGVEHPNSPGARLGQVRRIVVGHCGGDSLGGGTCGSWSAGQCDTGAGDKPEFRWRHHLPGDPAKRCERSNRCR